jgi:hypothetical protein
MRKNLQIPASTQAAITPQWQRVACGSCRRADHADNSDCRCGRPAVCSHRILHSSASPRLGIEMRKLFLLCLSVAALMSISERQLFAQGGGQGASRSLHDLSRAGSQGGGSQAAQSLSRATNSAGPASGRIGHAMSGLQRANSAGARVPDLRAPMSGPDQYSSNQQQILDRRLDQAEHLGGISERNGNERLLDTADRMEANALQNHARQTNLSPPADSRAGSNSPGQQLPAERVRSAKRGFWFQSR